MQIIKPTLTLLALLLPPALFQVDPAVMTARDLMALPVKAPDRVLPYGHEPSQYGELRLPTSRGPHPVVVLVHGGCFRQEYAGASSIGAMADALKREGIATWSIEYRRLSEPGGGWPGTYRDVGAGVDYIRQLAPRYRLDLSRVVILGHSAGGHLAHWTAARPRLEPGSALYVEHPFKPRGVVNLAGRMDMTVGIEEYEATCDIPVVRMLLGGLPGQVPERYAQVSLPGLLPLGVRQMMIWGSREDYVPAQQAQGFLAAAQRAGDDVQLRIVPGAGHFETASPSSSAWPVVLGAIDSLLGGSR
jgi:acetyl esterase/lipase